MQIIELYIRSQSLTSGTASSTVSNKLVNSSASFIGTVSIGDVIENISNNTTAKVTAVDSNTQLTLDNNIMFALNTYAVFSEYVKMDLFKDESLSISDSIQDVRDISKIFTTFSQQFNLPASKKNNKFFKHYQDSDVLNSFDARFKTDAIIKLNGIDFRKGKIRLNAVDLKDNKAYSYKVVFFGDVIELKDLMQDDDLSSLSIDPSLNFTYDNATVLSKFQSSIDLDVAFPLITHSKHFNIHTNNKYQSGSDKVIYTDLKPALKVRKIIDAIESKYNITFSNDFFNNTNFRSLYLLLHRASGAVSNALPSGGIFTVTNSFNDDLTLSSTTPDDEVRPFNSTNYYSFDYTITLSAPTEVIVRITSASGTLYAQATFNTAGSHTLSFNFGGVFNSNPSAPTDVLFTVESENTLTIGAQSLSVSTYTPTPGGGGVGFLDAVYDFPASTLQNTFVINRQLPQIKVIDFLTSLFKAYNLTAYKENGIIVVKSLQDFYNSGISYDITEYVEVDKSNISKLLQFKEIDFKFKSKEYFLVQASDLIQDDNFGNLSYGNKQFDGENYEIEIDFEKIMYERLKDGSVFTNMTQGSLLDSNLEPTIGAPLLLYCINTNPNGVLVWGGTGTPTLTNYKRPSNLNSSGNDSLNFGTEMDETTLASVTNSLFQNNYIDYISNIYDSQARKLKVTAYLPLRILLNYNLNDTFVIANKSYRINTIKTNLLTNKTDLELFNVFTSLENLGKNINESLPRVVDFETSAISSTTVNKNWTALSGATKYLLFKDNQLINSQTATSYQYTGLESGVTYKLSVQVEYGTDNFSGFTDSTETTT